MEKDGEIGQKGIIDWIILIIIALALLKYFFDWSIFDALASEEGRSTVGYIREVLTTIWSYIATPVTFAWKMVIKPLLDLAWDTFLYFLEWGRANLNTSAP